MHHANRLLELRTAAGMTQDQVAAAVGRKRSTVSRWESGDIPLAIKHAEKIAPLLNTSPAALFGWDAEVAA